MPRRIFVSIVVILMIAIMRISACGSKSSSRKAVRNIASTDNNNNQNQNGKLGGGIPVQSGEEGDIKEGRYPSQCGNIQISDDDKYLFVVNKTKSGEYKEDAPGSLSVFRVSEKGKDDNSLVEEVGVGEDPYSVSVLPNKSRAYVTNGADNNVSVIDLRTSKEIKKIPVGSEPRCSALSPSGKMLYVSNHSDGTVSVIDTGSTRVIKTIDLQLNQVRIKNPYALSVTNNKDESDADEKVYVADFYARGRASVPIDQREATDNGKEARIAVIEASQNSMARIIMLSPLPGNVVGFPGDRSKFSVQGSEHPIFKAKGADPTKELQGAFFNQLYHFALDPESDMMYVPAIGAAPAPPVKFNVNIQALVGVVDTASDQEITSLHRNLNNLIKVEKDPEPPFIPDNAARLDRAFMADTIALAIRKGTALFVSRGGSYVLRAAIGNDGSMKLEQNSRGAGIRLAVGNIPTGIVMNSSGTRAYINAEVSQTVTTLDLEKNDVMSTFRSADLPPPGSEAHMILIGKLAFFTGMGLSPENLVKADVRKIDTHTFRNLASNHNWSSCASCHPGGLADGVTWLFPTGPRQTPALDGTFALKDPNDQRVLNWNAVRGSVTDFNNNARNIQGGFGFSIDAARKVQIPGNDKGSVEDAKIVENHGPDHKTKFGNRTGYSDSLNLMTLWVQKGIRTPNRPSTLNAQLVNAGRGLFKVHCASCHGGAKWTSSQIQWTNPIRKGGQPLPPEADKVQFIKPELPVIVKFVGGVQSTDIIMNIGTLDLTNVIEFRGAGKGIGKRSVPPPGSFNSPSLLGVASTGPYGHHGRAKSLIDVFRARTPQGGLGHPAFGLSGNQLSAVVEFIRAIDEKEPPL